MRTRSLHFSKNFTLRLTRDSIAYPSFEADEYKLIFCSCRCVAAVVVSGRFVGLCNIRGGVESTLWNPHCGIHTAESTLRNPHCGIHTKESTLRMDGEPY